MAARMMMNAANHRTIQADDIQLNNGDRHINIDEAIKELDKRTKGPQFIQMGHLKSQIEKFVKQELYKHISSTNGGNIHDTIRAMIEHEVVNAVQNKLNRLETKVSGWTMNNSGVGVIELFLHLRDEQGNILPNTESCVDLPIGDILREMKNTMMWQDLFPEPPAATVNPAADYFETREV